MLENQEIVPGMIPDNLIIAQIGGFSTKSDV
jgi:hypothetical protein